MIAGKEWEAAHDINLSPPNKITSEFSGPCSRHNKKGRDFWYALMMSRQIATRPAISKFEACSGRMVPLSALETASSCSVDESDDAAHLVLESRFLPGPN